MGRAAFDNAVNTLYRAAVEPDRWPLALEMVADHIGGLGAMIVHNDTRHGGGSIVVGRLRDDLGQLYLRDHCINPWTIAAAGAGIQNGPLQMSRLIDHGVVKRTDFSVDILEPQRIVDMVVLPHARLTQAHFVGGFGVSLTSSQAENGAVATQRMGRLAPHLARAFELSLHLARQDDEVRRLGSLLDALPTAAMLLDRAGRIMRTNALAETLFRAADGISVGRDMLLTATLPHNDNRLRRAMIEALAAGSGGEDSFRQAVSVQRPSGLPPLLVILTPLPRSLFAFWELIGPGASLLVQIIDPVRSLDDRANALRQAYGLTNAEARVAGLVASGLSAPQVARALGLSVSTVRTHLARAFHKTGTHSQAGLVRLLSAVAIREPANPIPNKGAKALPQSIE